VRSACVPLVGVIAEVLTRTVAIMELVKQRPWRWRDEWGTSGLVRHREDHS